MAKTVVALYEDFETAQRVVQDLVNNGFDRSDISLVASDAEGKYSERLRGAREGRTTTGEAVGTGAGIGALLGGGAGLLVGLGALAIPGIGPVIAAGPLITTLAGAGIGAAAGGLVGALVSAGLPEEEARAYAEGVRRGGTLVTVNTSDEAADRAADIMRRYSPVDIESRAAMWRQEGRVGTEEATRTTTTTEERMAERPRATTEAETTLPIVEETLQVGKRQTPRGVRIHTRVVEQPIEEHITLREEHVDVERRRADRPLTEEEAEQAFRERTIEVSAISEEPVVHKEARVTGEIEIAKEAEEREEVVRGTVRRTEIDVERSPEEMRRRAEEFTTLRSDLQRHYTQNLSRSGRSFEDFLPIYQYGYDLATDPRYRHRDWAQIEAEASQEWARKHAGMGTWDEIKDAVREGWARTRARLQSVGRS
ncbi:MAG: DUF2382 domain-containing protein [Anaerolineae bacterium]